MYNLITFTLSIFNDCCWLRTNNTPLKVILQKHAEVAEISIFISDKNFRKMYYFI